MVIRDPKPLTVKRGLVVELHAAPILEGPLGLIMHHSFCLSVSNFLKPGFQGALVLAYGQYFS